MTLARKNLTIQDEDGNIVDGAAIQFRDESTLALPQCYSNKAGTIAIGNPYVAADGRNAGAYLTGGFYRITATLGAFQIEWRDEPVGLSQGLDFAVQDESLEVFTGATGTISNTTTTAQVNRVAPTATALTLPDASDRDGKSLRIGDYSTSVTDHVITLTPFQPSQKIMRQSTWKLNSIGAPSESPSFVNLASVTLVPILDPDDSANFVWVIAP